MPVMNLREKEREKERTRGARKLKQKQAGLYGLEFPPLISISWNHMKQ